MQRFGLVVLLLSLVLLGGAQLSRPDSARGAVPAWPGDIVSDDGEIAPLDEEMAPDEEVDSSGRDVSAAADYWSPPLSPWNPSYHFGAWTGTNYHLGDDVIRPAYTKVYNARWGYVRHVGYHTGFGWVVIVESPVVYESSTNPAMWRDTNVVCQVYGHLRNDPYLAATKARMGHAIDRGWIVGRLGTSSENGGWTPHLHYGIRRYRYAPCYWIYWGYSPYTSVRDQWYHPCSIITNY